MPSNIAGIIAANSAKRKREKYLDRHEDIESYTVGSQRNFIDIGYNLKTLENSK